MIVAGRKRKVQKSREVVVDNDVVSCDVRVEGFGGKLRFFLLIQSRRRSCCGFFVGYHGGLKKRVLALWRKVVSCSTVDMICVEEVRLIE